MSVEVQTICIGKRGADAMRRMNLPIMASFQEITNNTKFEGSADRKLVIHEFSSKFDKVWLPYRLRESSDSDAGHGGAAPW